MTYVSEDPRRSPRSKVFLVATLECGDRILPVTLRDLSEYGALIETEGGLTAGCEVWFHRNDLRLRGHVAWVEGKHAGIAFSRALKPEVVLRYIGRPQPRPADETLHRRPALTRPGMSLEEQRWAEEILRESQRRNRAD
ncbi:MAG: PilZ domain-containing protein [Sphingomicrobium sp.]